MPKALSVAVTGFAAGLGVTTALTFTLPGSNRGGMQATTLAVTKAMASNQFAEQRVILTPPLAVSEEPKAPAKQETRSPTVAVNIPFTPICSGCPGAGAGARGPRAIAYMGRRYD